MSNFRKIITFSSFLVLALALSIFSSKPVAAQTNAPGVWSSSINLQNVSGSTATVVITFYDASGNIVTTYTPSALAAGEALSIFVPAITTSPALPSGQYSVVVSSDVQILASVNTASTSSTSAPWTAFAYDGFDSSQAGDTLYFPGNYNNYFDFFSELVIQNTDPSTTANLTATFRDQSGSVIASGVSLGSVAPNASRTIAMSSIGSLPSGNSDGIFGAVVTSNEAVNLVGVANIWRTSPTNGTASYSGFTTGSSTLYPPALYNSYFGFRSALTLQNVSTSQNAIGTITYSNGETVNFNLSPGAAAEYFQPANTNLPSGNTNGIFSAEVTTTQGSIVGLVSLSSATGGPFASYNVPSAATSTVNIPNLLSDYYGYFSAVTVQNTGASACNMTITYADSSSKTINNVPAGGTANFIHLDNAGDVLPFRTSTSATVACNNNNPLVAVIQHNTSPNVAGYNSAKTPSDYLLAVTGVSD